MVFSSVFKKEKHVQKSESNAGNEISYENPFPSDIDIFIALRKGTRECSKHSLTKSKTLYILKK